MSDVPNITSSLALFPLALRMLVESELRAGNRVVEINSTPPAPMNGLCIRLEHPISTHVRASSPDMKYFERSSAHHSAEFSDPQRLYLVIDPPKDPAQEPDMDRIRAALNDAERAANADRFREGGFW